MTINVAIKCPEGLVLGADSLVSLTDSGGKTVAYAPRTRKIFRLGRLPAGLLLNGSVAMPGGRTIEDIVAEFGDSADCPSAAEPCDLQEVTRALRDFLAARIASGRPAMQLILGGYSRGKPGIRYGELYTITWDRDSDGEIRAAYTTDTDFGYIVGGQPTAINRFLAGFDRPTLSVMLDAWARTFETVKQYILDQLAASGATVPPAAWDIPLPPPSVFLPWSPLSSYTLGETVPDPDELLDEVLKKSRALYEPPLGFFSLPMAIDLAWHLMLMAYAESNYLPRLPVVGSRLTIATVTRDHGFEHVWSGEPGVSGPNIPR